MPWTPPASPRELQNLRLQGLQNLKELENIWWNKQTKSYSLHLPQRASLFSEGHAGAALRTDSQAVCTAVAWPQGRRGLSDTQHVTTPAAPVPAHGAKPGRLPSNATAFWLFFPSGQIKGYPNLLCMVTISAKDFNNQITMSLFWWVFVAFDPFYCWRYLKPSRNPLLGKTLQMFTSTVAP